MMIRTTYFKTRTKIVIIPDQFRADRFAFGVSIGDEPMQWTGNFESMQAAGIAAHYARRELVRTRKRKGK